MERVTFWIDFFNYALTIILRDIVNMAIDILNHDIFSDDFSFVFFIFIVDFLGIAVVWALGFMIALLILLAGGQIIDFQMIWILCDHFCFIIIVFIFFLCAVHNVLYYDVLFSATKIITAESLRWLKQWNLAISLKRIHQKKIDDILHFLSLIGQKCKLGASFSP